MATKYNKNVRKEIHDMFLKDVVKLAEDLGIAENAYLEFDSYYEYGNQCSTLYLTGSRPMTEDEKKEEKTRLKNLKLIQE